MNEREIGKIEKCKLLKDEIAGMLGMKEVIVIPVVARALGAIPTGFEKYLASIGIEMRVEHAQKTDLLGTARILRLVLGWYKKHAKKHHYKYHCARLCETCDNRLLSTLTESAGTVNNNALSMIINTNNDNNNNNNNNVVIKMQIFHSCMICAVCVALVSRLCCTRVACVSIMSHSCLNRVARIALVSHSCFSCLALVL